MERVWRIQGNLKWVIRLIGSNEYREGTVPSPLEEGEEEPGVVAYREWAIKSRKEKEEEQGITEATLEEDLAEVSALLSVGEDNSVVEG